MVCFQGRESVALGADGVDVDVGAGEAVAVDEVSGEAWAVVGLWGGCFVC